MSDTEDAEDGGQYKEKERIAILYQSCIDYFNNSQRSAILLNGGAVLVLLTFAGAVLGGEAPIDPKTRENLLFGIGAGSAFFALGLLAAGSANMLAYLSQISYFSKLTGEKISYISEDAHERHYIGAVRLILGSFILFSIGTAVSSYSIYTAFEYDPPAVTAVQDQQSTSGD